MLTSTNIKINKSILILFIIILYVGLFLYETYWIKPIPNVIIETPLDLTKVLLSNILDDILNNSQKRDEILNFLYTCHPTLSKNVPSCKSSVIFLNYISSFIDLDPFAKRAGIKLTTDMISYNHTMIKCLLYSNKEISNILIELLLQKQLDKSLLDLLIQCAKSLAITNPTKLYYYEVLLQFSKK